ncbi:MAG TPA: hypothetical protein VM238_09575 [Phycisphaerae bacterium]|nr:hypothetical protein [Phycisphaerae bacterium]
MPTFTDKVKRLERIRLALRRRYGDEPRAPVTHPVEHAVRTILGEEATREAVEKAMDRLRRHFIDWNDLRVSRPREIREVLGASFPRAGHKARVLPRLLDQVFKQHNSMVWDFLESMGKMETRAYFERLEEVRPFVAATMARDCVGAHTFPVDNDVARALGRLSIVDAAAESQADMQAMLERAVKSNRAFDLHRLVKRLAEQLCVVGTPLCPKCPLKKTCPSARRPTQRNARKKAKQPAGKKAAEKKAVTETVAKKTVGRKKARKKTAKRKAKPKRAPAPKGKRASAPKARRAGRRK